MNRLRFATTALAIACAAAGLSACKIDIEVPKGGRVVSTSGVYVCGENSPCTIDVVDQYFSDVFTATPFKGYSFYGWAQQENSLCGGRLDPCKLSTEGFSLYPQLMSEVESNTRYSLTPLFIKNSKYTRSDIRAEGNVEETSDGLIIDGSLILTGINKVEQVFQDAELQLKFDEEGDLLEIVGSAILPDAVTDHLGIIGSTRAELGLYKGHEINSDPDIGIHLVDERQYLVFYLGSSISLEVGDRKGGSNVRSISTPLDRKLILISDPLDQMYYYYGEMAGTAIGFAESDQSLLPYQPQFDYPGLKPFFGNMYKTGAVGVGIKAVDLIGLSGEFIIREPGFRDIDLEDPFNSTVAYFAGFNGEADVAISVLGFGLFDFDLAEASGSFKVQPLRALKQNTIGLYGRIAPDVSWQPSWMPIFPQTEIQAEFRFNAAGEVDAALRGSYRSTLPPANLQGSMEIDNTSVTMTTELVADGYTFPVSIRFEGQETHAVVGLDVSASGQIEREVESAFERVEQDIARTQEELLAAIDDFELELSLRGLRNAIPTMVGQSVSLLSGVPGKAYSQTYSAVRSEINKRRSCAGILGCIPSNAKRDAEARSAANSARSIAQGYVNPYISSLNKVKSQAALADDAEIREVLRVALLDAYSHRYISKKVTVSGSISGFSYTKSYSFAFDVLSPADAERILFAANNTHLIQESSDIVITKQDIVDRLPTDAILSEVRSKVQAGASQYGGVSEVGYTVIAGRYSAYTVLSNGKRYTVEFNVLSPDEALAALGKLILDTLF